MPPDTTKTISKTNSWTHSWCYWLVPSSSIFFFHVFCLLSNIAPWGALETLTKAVEATHHSKLEWLRSRGGDGAEQVHEVAKKVEELVLKARSTLQARPDTS